MTRLIRVVCILTAIAMMAVSFPDGLVAVLIVAGLSSLALWLFRRHTAEKEFITNVFLAALAARLLFGLLVYAFDFREFFGGDALTYHNRGAKILDVWFGFQAVNLSPEARVALSTGTPSWGMNYLVAVLYALFGKNFYAAQSFCAVFGAATAPMVYFCAHRIYGNLRVARLSAIAIAFFPSFIIWSSQLMKDGLIIFLLVLAMTMVLELQKSLRYGSLIVLSLSLFSIMSLRFYIFYMALIAVVGSFVVGTASSNAAVFRRLAVLILLGLSLTYLGVIRNASSDFAEYSDLERLQRSRMDLARSAQSGFNEDLDVSTTSGAISAVPIGLAYLMLAPFPWQAANLRQAITVPEVLIWWSSIPLIIFGAWYTIKNRLRPALPILVFSGMLTLAYSIFQGNVGTAYRQRTQIQVFLFVFVAVGFVLLRERQEDRRLIAQARQLEFQRQLRGGG
jgi:hypothetical protein